MNFGSQPHRRYNPLKDEWVVVSPQRSKRPWKGQQENTSPLNILKHDPACYLCPGNKRISGESNPFYKGSYVFPNDYPALIPNDLLNQKDESFFFQREAVSGICRVICFSPRHDLTLTDLSTQQILDVIHMWMQEVESLQKGYQWVQIFENRGAPMGCSNPHPHCQVWASDFLPDELRREDATQRDYYAKNGSPMLVDYLEKELENKERIICENDSWAVILPFWAVWPYETILLPKAHHWGLNSIDKKEQTDLSEIMKKLLISYDNLFDTSMPYSMGWHFAPLQDKNQDHWQLHAHYYPPLLRSSTVRKFMVGYEMLAGAQRDLTPEQAASRLRDASATV